MLSVRGILLPVLCSRWADASPLTTRYANTTLSRPETYTSTSSRTTSHAYIQPAHVDFSSSSKTCTTSAETDSNLPPRESPSAYGLGILTAPAPTTPPASTSLDFTFVGQDATSDAAPHFSYAPAQLSSSIEVASASSYSTRRYSNVSTVIRLSSTMVTLYTTARPQEYGALQTGSGGDVTVTSVTTIYPDFASFTSSAKKPEHMTSTSLEGGYGSVPPAYSSPSTSEATTTSSEKAPYYTAASGEEPTTTSSEHSSTTSDASATLFAYQPPSDEITSSTAHSTTTSSEATTASTSEAEQSSYAYPLPDAQSSEASTTIEPSAMAYSVPSGQTSLPPVIISSYAESLTATSSVAASSTSTIPGGITIVPVEPHSTASAEGCPATLTATVTDAGVTKTVTVAMETVTLRAY